MFCLWKHHKLFILQSTSLDAHQCKYNLFTVKNSAKCFRKQNNYIIIYQHANQQRTYDMKFLTQYLCSFAWQTLFIYLFIYLLCFASKHHTIIALKKLGHHNSLTPITVGPLQNININIENRNN